MKRVAWFPAAVVLLCAAVPAWSQSPPPPSPPPSPPPAPEKPSVADRVWVGGGIGLGFGDVTWVSVEPIVGYSITPRFGVGGRLIYRYREDDRFSPSLNTSDYGASLFARFFVLPPAVFLQAEYEHLSYEFPVTGGGTDRDDFDSVLGGGGISRPIGGRASFFALALYNFSYDDDELSPYDDPWIIRVGVGVGF